MVTGRSARDYRVVARTSVYCWLPGFEWITKVQAVKCTNPEEHVDCMWSFGFRLLCDLEDGTCRGQHPKRKAWVGDVTEGGV